MTTTDSFIRAIGRSIEDRGRQTSRFLDAANNRVVHSSELEAVTGLSRFELARQVRSRLDSGFCDLAHFTRLFRVGARQRE